MNNRRKQETDNEKIREAKAHEQKIREFQENQQQQLPGTSTAVTPNKKFFPARAGPSNVKNAMLTPGQIAIPPKKTKQEEASPFAFAAVSPAIPQVCLGKPGKFLHWVW